MTCPGTQGPTSGDSAQDDGPFSEGQALPQSTSGSAETAMHTKGQGALLSEGQRTLNEHQCRRPQDTLWTPTGRLTGGDRGSACRALLGLTCVTNTQQHTTHTGLSRLCSDLLYAARETRNPSNPGTFCWEGPGAHTDSNTDQAVRRAPPQPQQPQQHGLWPSCPLAAPAWPAHPQ